METVDVVMKIENKMVMMTEMGINWENNCYYSRRKLK